MQTIIKKTMAFCLSVIFGGCAGLPEVNTVANPTATTEKILAGKVAVIASSGKDTGNYVADLISASLMGIGFRIVERSRLEAILKEHNLSLTGLLEKENYNELGKISNIDNIFLVSGMMSSSGNVSSLVLKLVDLKTGDIILSTNYSQPRPDEPLYIGHDSLNGTVKAVAESIMEVLDPSKRKAPSTGYTGRTP